MVPVSLCSASSVPAAGTKRIITYGKHLGGLSFDIKATAARVNLQSRLRDATKSMPVIKTVALQRSKQASQTTVIQKQGPFGSDFTDMF